MADVTLTPTITSPHTAAAPVQNDCGDEPLVLTVRDLASGYNGHRALEGFTFDVHEGERIGIVGPNGAGKSTLFKALVGLLPHQGAISILGASCKDSHAMVGYVPQHELIDFNFPATVWDVVMMGRARQIGYILPPRKRDRHAVREALDRVGMWHLRKRQIGELSGGQRRRVFVARALAQQASVLLLDEPFSGVDATAETDIFVVLDVLREEGVAVLLATHNLVQAATHYDTLMLINAGRMIAFGPPNAIYTPDNLAATFGDRIALIRDGERVQIIADRPCCDHQEHR
jgi:ABC-type Mn2+/Zn2+ transport system ATPase subunit